MRSWGLMGRVSVWDDEKVLEMGNDGTTEWIEKRFLFVLTA